MVTPSTVLDRRRYGRLLAKALPKVIDTDEENEAAIARVEQILSKSGKACPEEKALARMLVILIEAFETEHYAIGGSTPQTRLKVLMVEHGLRQVDLLEVFGSRSTASEVLRDKRRISRALAGRLGERFGVPASLFLAE